MVGDRGGNFGLAGSVASGTAPDQSGRFRFVHAGRTPGKPYTYQVVAVRQARDPIDDTGAGRRDIASLSSEPRVGRAISAGPLAPPTNLTAVYEHATGAVQVSWQNADHYESVEVWRREDGRFTHLRAGAVGGTDSAFIDPGLVAGTWFYQLRAKGVSRETRTPADAQVVVP
ncbi:MAG: hypothetical protein ACT4OM_07975 [Actinomycetota bacterium]